MEYADKPNNMDDISKDTQVVIHIMIIYLDNVSPFAHHVNTPLKEFPPEP